MERNFRKSSAHSQLLTPNTPGAKSILEMQEVCSLCKESIPEGRMVIRNEESNSIVCVLCIVAIAEMIE